MLTIDLDAFVSPVRRNVGKDSKRPSDADYRLHSEASIRSFLEQNLGFSRGKKFPATFITKHDEAFILIKKEVEAGKIATPFVLVNVDAHSDLGLGEASWKAILTELIVQPVDQRPSHDVTKTKLNEGNWVSFALACRWPSEYLLVKPGPSKNDLFPYFFIDGRQLSQIQLFSFTQEELEKFQRVELDDYPTYFQKRGSPEPVVKFSEIEPKDFSLKTRPAKVIICHSPLFIPPAADSVIPLMREYFDF